MWPTTKCVAPRWSTSFSAECSGPRRPISSRTAASASQPGIDCAGVHERDVGALEHRRRTRRGSRPRGAAERRQHVGRRRAALGPERRAAVHDDARARGGGEDRRGERQVRRVDHAVVGAGAGDDRAVPRDGGPATRRGRVAQRLRHAGELGRRLALDPHRDEERARLHGADLARQQRGRRHARLLERQRAAAARPGPDGLDDRPEARVAGAPAALGEASARGRRRRPRRASGRPRSLRASSRRPPSGSRRCARS